MASKYIIRFNETGAKNIELTGGKGASLSELIEVTDVFVPDGFSLTTLAYEDLVEISGLEKKIHELEKSSDNCDQEKIRELSRVIRETIFDFKIPLHIRDSIEHAYIELGSTLQIKDLSVAVRSSATAEDSPYMSFAGQLESYLNQIGIEQILDSVKLCWASLFGDRVIEYRNNYKMPHSKVKMAVSILQMIKGISAGVGFTADIISMSPGITIEANYGLGESVVQGIVSPDYWLLDENGESILMGRLGNKKEKVVYKKKGGTKRVDVKPDAQSKFVFSNEAIKEIARHVRNIGEHYKKKFSYKYVDTEFVVDPERRLYFVQARAETAISSRQSSNITFLDVYGIEPIIVGGECACHNVSSGRIKTVAVFDSTRKQKPKSGFSIPDNPNEHDIFKLRDHIRPGDIMVATKTVPSFETVMKDVEGIVTEEGGLSCHAAIIAREYKKPCIVGMADVVGTMQKYEEQTATMDPSKTSIYLGDLMQRFLSEGNLKEVTLRAYEDQVVQGNIDRLIAELGKETDTNIWFGRPMHPIGNLQMQLYKNAIERLNRRFDIDLKYKIENSVLKTPKSDNLVLYSKMRALRLDGLEKYFEERVRVVREYEGIVRTFDDSPQDVEKFIDVYTKMIEHFHTRWIFDHLIGVMQKEKTMQLPLGERMYADLLYVSEVLKSPFKKTKEKEYERLLAHAKESQDLLRLIGKENAATLRLKAPDLYKHIDEFAKKYPDTDSVDMRLPHPLDIIIEALKNDLDNYKRKIPVLYTFDLPKGFDDELRRIIALNIRQTIQKEVEPFVHIGGQYAIRNTLLNMGEKAVSRDLLKSADEIFELIPNDLISMAFSINKAE